MIKNHFALLVGLALAIAILSPATFADDCQVQKAWYSPISNSIEEIEDAEWESIEVSSSEECSQRAQMLLEQEPEVAHHRAAKISGWVRFLDEKSEGRTFRTRLEGLTVVRWKLNDQEGVVSHRTTDGQSIEKPNCLMISKSPSTVEIGNETHGGISETTGWVFAESQDDCAAVTAEFQKDVKQFYVNVQLDRIQPPLGTNITYINSLGGVSIMPHAGPWYYPQHNNSYQILRRRIRRNIHRRQTSCLLREIEWSYRDSSSNQGFQTSILKAEGCPTYWWRED